MRSASSESESNRHVIIDCQSALGVNKRWHFIVLGSGPKNRRQYMYFNLLKLPYYNHNLRKITEFRLGLENGLNFWWQYSFEKDQ